MTESSQVNRTARENLAPYGRWERCENRLTEGWPDTYAVLCRKQVWFELKLAEPSGKAPKHFTLEQLMWGEAEVRAGGRWYLLVLWKRTWLLMNTTQARAWFEGAPPQGIIQQTGRFPTRAILKELTK